jgi:hypothetical protein
MISENPGCQVFQDSESLENMDTNVCHRMTGRRLFSPCASEPCADHQLFPLFLSSFPALGAQHRSDSVYPFKKCWLLQRSIPFAHFLRRENCIWNCQRSSSLLAHYLSVNFVSLWYSFHLRDTTNYTVWLYILDLSFLNFFFPLLLCWVGVHGDIYKGSYMYQICHTWIHSIHCSPLSLPSPDSWNSFSKYCFCTYIHVYTFFALYLCPYPFPRHLLLPTGTNHLPYTGPTPLSCSPIL